MVILTSTDMLVPSYVRDIPNLTNVENPSLEQVRMTNTELAMPYRTDTVLFTNELVAITVENGWFVIEHRYRY